MNIITNNANTSIHNSLIRLCQLLIAALDRDASQASSTRNEQTQYVI